MASITQVYTEHEEAIIANGLYLYLVFYNGSSASRIDYKLRAIKENVWTLL